MIDGEPPNDGTAVDGAGVDGAGPPNKVTSVVSIQRQRRLYRMAILTIDGILAVSGRRLLVIILSQMLFWCVYCVYALSTAR
jgi:hypothetical protein